MNEYRLSTSTMNFNVFGRLENVEGTYILRLRVTTDQALAVKADVKAELAIGILAIANGQAILPAQTLKVKVRPEGGGFVELAMLMLA